MSTQTEPATTSPTPPERRVSSPDRNDRIRLVAVLVAIGGVLLLAITAVALMSADDDPTAEDDAASWGGSMMAPAPARPEFTLTDTEGRPYDFGAETRGELTLLFFGYTNCPDICPVQMAVLASALEKPGMPQANVVFVSTDPDRDTPERLRSWLDQFPGGTSFVGLRGPIDQVVAAETAARVAPSEKLPASGDDYEVGHAAQIMAYTPDDKAHLAYPSGVRSEDWIADLPRMMERWGSGSASSTEAGSGAASDDDAAVEPSAPVVTGDITVRDGFAAAGEEMTAVYVTIDNDGDDDALVGVRSPAADEISMMGGADESGMQDAAEVPVPRGTTSFAAGAGHIMVTLDEPVEAGDTLPVELEFADAGKVDVDVRVLSWEQMVDQIDRAAAADAGGDGS
jgi:cytochrome oxidase Cu insertion factor (SCO1/SenC/PrrC family)/copper(I)-binding protein